MLADFLVLDYCPPPPPPPTADTHAHSGDNVWDFNTHLLCERGMCMLRWWDNLCRPWSDCSFGGRLIRVYAIISNIYSNSAHTNNSTLLKYFSINSNTPRLKPMLKIVIWNNKVAVLKARGKRALADVTVHCKMMSVITLDGKTLQIHVNVHAKQFNYCRISSVQWRKVGRSWRLQSVYCVFESK